MNYPNLARPLLSKELIGREAVLDSLNGMLEQAAGGRPQLVLLAGEAGLGKTRLCQALIEQSRARRFRLLFGQAARLFPRTRLYLLVLFWMLSGVIIQGWPGTSPQTPQNPEK
jgi:hypothetical protein